MIPSQLLHWGHEVKGRGREKDHLTLLVGATLDGVWQTQGMYVRRAIFALSDRARLSTKKVRKGFLLE